jgi:hypothetical protein
MPMNPRLLRPTSTSGHPEANAWRTAVVANGGSVSVTTGKAVSDFCASIDAAGIRDRFFRLNLFAGTGLNACLVPLYRGQSRTGTQWGNALDGNNGPFVSSDYVETGTGGGLATGASNTTKFLATGLSPFAASIPFNNTHISYYARAAVASNGNVAGATANNRTWQAYPFGALSTFVYRSGGNTNSGIESQALSGTNRSGHLVAVRNSSTAVLFRNGSDLGLTATVTDTSAFDADPGGLYIYGRNLNLGASLNQQLSATLQGYSLGLAMDTTQAAAFYTAMQAFQTALGRQL